MDKLPSRIKKKERPTNAMQRIIAHRMGFITGFVKLRNGRPKKPPNHARVKSSQPDRDQPQPAPTKISISKPKKQGVLNTPSELSLHGRPNTRPQYRNWKAPKNAKALADSVDAVLNGEDPQLVAGDIIIPRGTLDRAVKAERKRRKDEQKRAVHGNLDVFARRDSKKERGTKNGHMLTTEEDREFIQKVVKMRDENNNGVAWTEVISLIMTLTCASRIRGTNHFNYLRWKKMLPDLKNHGKTQAAQRTTTKRSNVNTEKLLHWHGTIDEALEEQKRLNKYDPHFLGLVDHFMMNLDESSMVASNGVLRVVGSAEKRKHEKITDDNRDSISTIRVGSSAGADGPRIYLTQGKKWMWRHCGEIFRRNTRLHLARVFMQLQVRISTMRRGERSLLHFAKGFARCRSLMTTLIGGLL